MPLSVLAAAIDVEQKLAGCDNIQRAPRGLFIISLHYSAGLLLGAHSGAPLGATSRITCSSMPRSINYTCIRDSCHLHYNVTCFLFLLVVMEKQLEELKQQLEKQCLINQELQRQNKDLGECITAQCGLIHCYNSVTESPQVSKKIKCCLAD